MGLPKKHTALTKMPVGIAPASPPEGGNSDAYLTQSYFSYREFYRKATFKDFINKSSTIVSVVLSHKCI